MYQSNLGFSYQYIYGLNDGKPVGSLIGKQLEWNEVILLGLSDIFRAANIGVGISVGRGVVSGVGSVVGDKVESGNDA